jgi:hypothetical protein
MFLKPGLKEFAPKIYWYLLFMGQYKMISILIKMISIFEINLPVDIDQ